MRTKPTMRVRMLGSVLAAIFSTAVAFGVLGGFGLVGDDTDTSIPPDSGWTSVEADSGWTSAPADSGWTNVLADSGWTNSASKDADV
ncbi:hypothetical protein [Streptomyces ipomoeae]|uniref:hypothetical protein n=1 Tax=Streptomyces ipomoeae TaxID=103232 RepID=UPI0015F082D8|nr:hypothetical protein [Streptomyces ipomoeae]MDX2936820.1 hypothetical protein [Streptomyces ipomoeae]